MEMLSELQNWSHGHAYLGYSRGGWLDTSVFELSTSVNLHVSTCSL